VSVVTPKGATTTLGDYGEEGFVYQALASIPRDRGRSFTDKNHGAFGRTLHARQLLLQIVHDALERLDAERRRH
jgi:hypothetical protein